MKSFRDIEPFRQGQPASSSDLEAMRRELGKYSPTPGSISSPGSYSHSPRDYPLREKFVFANASGADIPQYSIFTVKRSLITNTPHGPPVEVEGFFFQYGFVYATNQECAAPAESPFGYWAETISSLPVLINYDPQFSPKIGHQMGPNGEGQLALNRAGYVVIGEPDIENSRVWVCKSNDQQIRVKITDLEIKHNSRGTGIVIGEDTVSCNFNYPGDPDKVDVAQPFQLDYILNLTERSLYLGDAVFVTPVLGLGLVVNSLPPAEIVPVQVLECFNPGDKDKRAVLMQLSDCEWVKDEQTEILLSDINNAASIVPEFEQVWAIARPYCCSQFTNQGETIKRRFDVLGSYGLHRLAIARQRIECNSTGAVEIILKVANDGITTSNNCQGATAVFECVPDLSGEYRYTQGFQGCPPQCTSNNWPEGVLCNAGSPPITVPCGESEQTEIDGCEETIIETGCYLNVCNKIRCIEESEEVELDYVGSSWVVTPRPKNAKWIGILENPLCPTSLTASVGQLEPLDICTTETFDVAENRFRLAGLSGDEVLIERSLVSCNSIPFISQIRHQCRDIVVHNVCDGQFTGLRKTGCNIQLLVQAQTSIATCIEIPTYVTVLQLTSITIPEDVTLTMQSGGGTEECDDVLHYTCRDNDGNFEFELNEGYTCEPGCVPEPPDSALCNENTQGQVFSSTCVPDPAQCRLRLRKRLRNICVIDSSENPQVTTQDDFVTFTLQEIEVNPRLDFTANSASGSGSESGEPCENPKLSIEAQKIKVMVCVEQAPEYESVSSIDLYIQDAFVESSTTTDENGRVCKNLIPETFVVFAPCKTLDPEPFICGKPCIAEGGSGEGE